MENTTPELPIFKTVDSAQRIRIVYAFYAASILHEFDTREEAEEARQKMLKHTRASRLFEWEE